MLTCEDGCIFYCDRVRSFLMICTRARTLAATGVGVRVPTSSPEFALTSARLVAHALHQEKTHILTSSRHIATIPDSIRGE